MGNLIFKDILDGSVHLFDTSLAVWPQEDFEEKPVVMTWSHINQYEKKYSASNNVIQFVYHGNLYVDVWEYGIIEVLKSEGFEGLDSETEWYVNFSQGEYPRDYKYYWFKRIKETEEDVKRSFVKECKAFYKRRGIRNVSQNFLNFCFEIPEEGIEIETFKKDRVTIFPPKHNPRLPLQANIIWLLGVYDIENGVVTFVTSDGRQMVASFNSGIVEELERCRYEHEPRYVPFANREKANQFIIGKLMEKDIWI